MDLERWRKFSFSFQIGQIGSELARARLAEERNDGANRDKAIFRAMELLDLSLSDERWRLRYRELTRFREILGDWLSNTHAYQFSLSWIENYCTQIVLASKSSQNQTCL